MKKLFPYLLFPFTFFTIPLSTLSAQNHVIDSLKQVLKSEKEDTNKVKTLNALSEKLWQIGSLDTSEIYANSSETLAEKLGYNKGIGKAFRNIGVVYEEQGNYQGALEYGLKALAIFQETEDKIDIAYILCDIGAIYSDQSNYPKALEYSFKALDIEQQIRDKNGIAYSLGNIGLIYMDLGNYPKALEYYFKALATDQQIGDKNGSSINLGNIGLIYEHQRNFPQALEFHFKALAISKELGDKIGIAYSLGTIGIDYTDEGKYPEALEYYLKSLAIGKELGKKDIMADNLCKIGTVYSNMGNYSQALEYYFKALTIEQEIGNKYGYAIALCGIGDAYSKQKNFKQAKEYLDSALILSKNIGEKDAIENTYSFMSVLDSATGNYKTAWEDYKKYIVYRDSLVNEAEIKKSTAAEMNYDFGRKTDSAKAIQAIADAVATKEKQREKVVRNAFVGGFSIMFLAAIVFFFQRNRIAKEKKRSDELLLNILPSEVAEELKTKGSADAKQFDEVTVMFTDFKGFTSITEKLSAKELVTEIDYCFKGFDNIIHKYAIEKIKTIGDSYMAAGGLPVANQTHAKDVVNAALEIVQFMEAHKQQRLKENKPIFEIRIGINTGPVVAGIVGVKKFAYDIWGDTVNLASRMESSGEPGKVNISGSTYELVKNEFNCTYRGKIQAKNKGEVDMYFVS